MNRHTYWSALLRKLQPCAVALALAWPGVAAADAVDRHISNWIESKLFDDPAVPADEIDVETTRGIVTLRGRTDNVLAKQHATRIAELVKGVRAVVNRIEVTASRPDDDIRRDVLDALRDDPATSAYQVDAEVEGGMVTLSGSVELWQERDLAAKVAQGVRGVRGVKNELAVEYDSDLTNREIAAAIRKLLRWDVLVDHGLIDVSARDGRIVLRGTVGSAAERRRAIAHVWIAGVRSVDASDLKVARWAREEAFRRDKYVVKGPDEVREAVFDALQFDPRVASFDIEVEVEGATVTLRGTVDNLKAKRAAETDARNTVGVVAVENRLEVKPRKEVTDEQIAAAVRRTLEQDPYLESEDITVQVYSGVVSLLGTVESRFAKLHAEDRISRVYGVLAVRNELEVEKDQPPVFSRYIYAFSPTPDTYLGRERKKSDAEIAEDIRDQLWWSPFVDSDEVDVSVEDGVAILTGTVETRREADAAVENAWEGGAVQVKNFLENLKE